MRKKSSLIPFSLLNTNKDVSHKIDDADTTVTGLLCKKFERRKTFCTLEVLDNEDIDTIHGKFFLLSVSLSPISSVEKKFNEP